MFDIEFEKACACLKRSEFFIKKEFSSQEDAIKYAQNLCETINKKFCQKHIFSYVKKSNTILIQMDIRE